MGADPQSEPTTIRSGACLLFFLQGRSGGPGEAGASGDPGNPGDRVSPAERHILLKLFLSGQFLGVESFLFPVCRDQKVLLGLQLGP